MLLYCCSAIKLDLWLVCLSTDLAAARGEKALRTFRVIIAALVGVFGLFLLAGGVALTNAVGDFGVADQQLVNFMAAFVDIAELSSMADQGALIMFLSGAIAIGLAWWMWPRGR